MNYFSGCSTCTLLKLWAVDKSSTEKRTVVFHTINHAKLCEWLPYHNYTSTYYCKKIVVSFSHSYNFSGLPVTPLDCRVKCSWNSGFRVWLPTVRLSRCRCFAPVRPAMPSCGIYQTRKNKKRTYVLGLRKTRTWLVHWGGARVKPSRESTSIVEPKTSSDDTLPSSLRARFVRCITQVASARYDFHYQWKW